MSVNDLLSQLENYTFLAACLLTAVPVFTFLYAKLVARRRGILAPHKYVYAVLIYLACGPGVFSAVLTLYVLFILKASLLEANLVYYLLPIVTMILTLNLVRKSVDLNRVPGFDRIQGLMILLGVAFILALMVMKMRIFLFFGAPMISLLLWIVVLYLILKWAAGRVLGSKS